MEVFDVIPRQMQRDLRPGESRNPGSQGFLDPGFRRGDGVGNLISLELMSLVSDYEFIITKLRQSLLSLTWPRGPGFYQRMKKRILSKAFSENSPPTAYE